MYGYLNERGGDKERNVLKKERRGECGDAKETGPISCQGNE
jgi:hypothetical protein